MSRVSRRGFLLVLLCGLGAGLLFFLRRGARHRYPATVVRARLGYLRTDPADLARFSQDYLRCPLPGRGRLLRLACALAPLGVPARWLGRRAVIDELEEHICQIFLLSSDFFPRGAREDLPVRYLSIYDPRRAPCRNPFARLEPEQG